MVCPGPRRDTGTGAPGSPSVKPVVIVGGGLSGLASGVLLSRYDIPVLLLEQKPAAGGRTSSFRDPATGEALDNGQHTLIAGYEATNRFLTLLGTAHLLRVQERPRLRFHHPVRGFCTLELPRLSAPYNLGAGILRTDLLSGADRVRLLRAGISLLTLSARREARLAEWTIEEWLTGTGQSAEARRSFWEPLAVSVMNETCDRASALVFLRALRKAFLGHWRAAAFAVPTVGLSDLFVQPAVALIRRAGGEVRCGASVVELLTSGGVASGVRVRGSGDVEARGVVLAVPSDKVVRLLPAPVRSATGLAGFDDFALSPIVSIYLWYRENFMGSEEILGLIGTRIQWLFNRRALVPSTITSPRGFVCGVISAAHQSSDLSNEELTRQAVEDLRGIYGEAAAAPLHAMVLRERRATFSPTPAFERRRPGAATSIPGLFLAGDWTATGLPATIEGAVLSAERCAERVRAWRAGRTG